MTAASTPHDQNLNIIVIDDDPAQVRLIEHRLRTDSELNKRRIRIHTFEDPLDALSEAPVDELCVVLLDYELSNSTGLDWIQDFVREDIGPVVMLTATGDEQIAATAFKLGVTDYIIKDAAVATPNMLLRAVDEGTRRFLLQRTNRMLRQHLRTANKELAQKNNTLSELTRTAHQFVDDVAHEFRTPLAVIQEFSAILSDGIGGSVTDKQQEFLDFISHATRDLSHLIDDFLDSGRLRARTLRVDRRDHSIDDILDATWLIMETRAKERNITLTRDVAEGLPRVYADADKMRRTLINLVINAIKFSSPGDEVIISVTQDEWNDVRVGVRDHGPGLSREEAEALFQRFQQGNAGRRISSKGFGLGLTIVKELVAVNHGTVNVKSAQGEGSTFSFTVPRYDQEAILDAFLERMSERDHADRVTVLRLSSRDGADDVDVLQTFASNHCHATDIQLAAPDGTSVLLIGETPDARGWRRRMLEADEERRAFHPTPSRVARDIEIEGTWSLRDVRQELKRILSPTPQEERHCA